MMNRVTVAVPTDATGLLAQLYWHHVSQAKGAPQCTTGYHQEIATKLAHILGMPAPKKPKG